MAVELEFDSVSGLLAHLLGREPGSSRWFRGQGCHTHELVPSLYRRLSTKTPDNVLSVEKRLITRFRQRSLPWWPEGYPQTDWEHLFAMQHYGVPTRLLDWSESALSGLFFAADHDPEQCKGSCDGDCVATLWVLDPELLNRQNPRLSGMPVAVLTSSDRVAENWQPGVSESQFAPSPIALYGTHNSRRIAAQQGTFTVAGKSFEPLEDSDLGKTDGVLERLEIHANHHDIRAALRLLGVNEATVYPDMPGLAHDITAAEVF